jgi:hypothetical protein
MRVANEKAEWDQPDMESFNLEAGTKFYLSSDTPEKVCGLIDTNNFDQIGVETLKATTGGGIFVRILQVQK